MKIATIDLNDEVNCTLNGVDPATMKACVDTLTFMVPYARHVLSFQLGRWDGKKNFMTRGGRTYISLLPRIIPVLLGNGYEIEIGKDARPVRDFKFEKIDVDFLSEHVWPKGHPMAGQKVQLRDHQVEAINRYLENPASIQEISTSAGKTVITAVLSMKAEPYGRSLIIVPGKDLVVQTEKDYKMLGLDVGVFFGDRKERGRAHTICTWQSLGAFFKRDKKGHLEENFADFIKDVVCVMVDEVHSAKADVLFDLLTSPLAFVPLRWGLTGTIPKEEFERCGIIASLGDKVGEIRADELQAKGILSNCFIDIVQTDDDDMMFDGFPDELRWLTTDEARVAYMAKRCIEISSGGNTLILVGRIELGEALAAAIPGSVFISGKVKSTKRAEHYDEVSYVDSKIIIATFGVAAVGINIPRIFKLVLIEPGKSFIRVIQSIGRGLRTAEDKDFIGITDLCASTKYSKQHLTERKKYYKDAGYAFKVVKTKYK